MPSPRIDIHCPHCNEFTGQHITKPKPAPGAKKPKPKIHKCKRCETRFTFASGTRTATIFKLGIPVPPPKLNGARAVRRIA